MRIVAIGAIVCCGFTLFGGPRAGLAGACLIFLVSLALPRLGHRNFELSHYRVAKLLFTIFARVGPSLTARATSKLYIAACYLRLAKWNKAKIVLEECEDLPLSPLQRSVWSNNYSYLLCRTALAETKQAPINPLATKHLSLKNNAVSPSGDTQTTLASACIEAEILADQAIALHPRVAAYHHTKAIALLYQEKPRAALHSLHKAKTLSVDKNSQKQFEADWAKVWQRLDPSPSRPTTKT